MTAVLDETDGTVIVHELYRKLLPHFEALKCEVVEELFRRLKADNACEWESIRRDLVARHERAFDAWAASMDLVDDSEAWKAGRPEGEDL